jgi:two-component system response regulator YesN
VRVFRTSLGTTPGRYLTDMRIRDAQSLLAHSSFSIKEISAMLGFEDQLYFSRVFRQKVGLSPKAFRLRGATGRPRSAVANEKSP